LLYKGDLARIVLIFDRLINKFSFILSLMKVNQFITKIVVRVFFILVFAAMIPFFTGDQTRLQHIYFTFPHKWQMIFPIILILAFISLLITCSVKKYKEPELNWLLILNTVILVVYGAAIFIRVSHMV
jgi:hypothetical protein